MFSRSVIVFFVVRAALFVDLFFSDVVIVVSFCFSNLAALVQRKV